MGSIRGSGLVPKHVARRNNPTRVVDQEQGNGFVLLHYFGGKGQVHLLRGLHNVLHGHSPTRHFSGLAKAQICR